MIEYNFTELDNDFITCWSKYLLTGDIKLVIKDIEKLAELGQVNAIQVWYSINAIGTNKNIDKIVDSLGENYNDLYIKAIIESKNEWQKGKLQSLLEYVDETEIVQTFVLWGRRPTERAMQATRDIFDIPFVHLYDRAIGEALSVANRTGDMCVLETANEITYELSEILGLNNPAKQAFEDIRKNNRLVCDNVLKQIKASKKENPSYNLLDNPVMCFTLAKAIVLFNGKHKQKTLAVELLKELSNRRYSETLTTAKSTKR